jgi:hypothetical protein
MIVVGAYAMVHLLFFISAWKLFILERFNALTLLLVVSAVGTLPLFGVEQLGVQRAIAILGVVSLVFLTTITGKSRGVLRVQALVLVLLAFVLVAYFLSPHVPDGTNRLMNFIFNYALVMMFIPWRSNEKHVEDFYKAWLLLAMTSSVLTILQTAYGSFFWHRYYLRSTEIASRIFETYSIGPERYFSGFGLFDNRSHNALFQGVALFYVLLSLLKGNTRRLPAYAAMLLLMVGILLSRSRAGVGCALIGFLACLVVRPGKSEGRSHVPAAVAFAFTILVGGTYFFSDELFRPLALRLEPLGASGIENPLLDNERVAMWAYFMADRGIQLSDILRPFGVGFGSSPPDNVYLTVGFEVGFFGLVTFALIIMSCAIGAYRLYQRNKSGRMSVEIFVTFLGVSMFAGNFLIGNLYFFEQIFMQVAPFAVYLTLRNAEAKTGSLAHA